MLKYRLHFGYYVSNETMGYSGGAGVGGKRCCPSSGRPGGTRIHEFQSPGGVRLSLSGSRFESGKFQKEKKNEKKSTIAAFNDRGNKFHLFQHVFLRYTKMNKYVLDKYDLAIYKSENVDETNKWINNTEYVRHRRFARTARVILPVLYSCMRTFVGMTNCYVNI